MSEDAVFRKCAWRIVPFAMLLFIVSYIDRTNVGFAALTMNRDLGFSATVYGFGAGIFFAGYLTSQLPASAILPSSGIGATTTHYSIHPTATHSETESRQLADLNRVFQQHRSISPDR